MTQKALPTLARLALGIALAVSARSARAEEPPCRPGMQPINGVCGFIVMGEVQTPVAFEFTMRRQQTWQRRGTPPENTRRAVLDATRSNPF
jgi:hypothetical protein